MTDAIEQPVPCPLRSCGATVAIVVELQAPGSDARVRRLMEHRYVAPGSAADGQLCPASLMALPLSVDAVAALVDAERSMPVERPASDADLWFGAGDRKSVV